MTFGSLFAGIGGLDLGLERAGMQCKWQVEINPYAQRVLTKHWPEVRRHDDIKTWPENDTESVDLICGGFPCQDISFAGKGAGLSGERSGLFYELIRVVREMGPRYVLLENVSALLVRGIDDVLGTLASIGFDAEWHCIPAFSVGAPHIRDRVFVMAYAQHNGLTASEGEYQNDQQRTRREEKQSGVEQPTGSGRGRTISADVADARSTGDLPDRRIHRGDEGSDQGDARTAIHAGAETPHTNDTASTGRKTCFADRMGKGKQTGRVSVAHSGWWTTEPDVGRVANGVPARVDRLRGLGNAVVPQVAEFIGNAIVEHERRQSS